MEILTIDDLVPGEYYVAIDSSSGYIFLSDGDNSQVHCCSDNGRTYNSKGCMNSNKNSFFKYYRNATPEEIRHLQECIAKGKYVPKSKIVSQIIDNYQIY